MKVFYADHHVVELPATHRFPMFKYRALRLALLEHGLLDASELEPATPIALEPLRLTHDPDYVEAFLQGSLDPRAMRRIGLPWSTALVDRTRAACHGTLLAALHALTHGTPGANLAGGTHHACHAHGEGFCVFNDLAVTTRWLQHLGLVERVTVLDLDVHQGNGSAALLAEDPRVYTLSIHGEKNYPYRKVAGTRDIALPDGCEDQAYLKQLAPALDAALAHRPDLILYQAGVDALAEDRLGRLALTHEGLLERDRLVFLAAQHHGIPIAITLGGGYADPIEPTLLAHMNTYRALREVFHPAFSSSRR